jgi:AbrB family looped-hinge helix DNA binding protein
MVTFNGRITIPIQVRKELGLKTGDNVNFVEVEKGRYALISGGSGDYFPNLDRADADIDPTDLGQADLDQGDLDKEVRQDMRVAVH